MCVVDFFSMYQTKAMMRQIFQWFKEHNPSFERVESVIIDKDIKEWTVLEEEFPRARVRLHVMFRATLMPK